MKVQGIAALTERVELLLEQNSALFSELTRLRGDLERSGAIKARPAYRAPISYEPVRNAEPLPSVDVRVDRPRKKERV
jgi:hypothetical protein